MAARRQTKRDYRAKLPAQIKTDKDAYETLRWSKQELELGLEAREMAIQKLKELMNCGAPSIELLASKVLLETFGVSAADLKKVAEGTANVNARIQVMIAPWASAKPEQPRVEHQVREVEVDYVKADRELEDDAPRSTPATPEPTANPDNAIVAYNKWGTGLTRRDLDRLKSINADMSGITMVGDAERLAAENEFRHRPLSGADAEERKRQVERNAADVTAVSSNFDLFK